ncbi:hypothetical protein [Rhizobacter sp. P5_C2]
MHVIHTSRPADPARGTPLPDTSSAPTATASARRFAWGVALAMTVALTACGGSNDNKDCGSAGNTRDLHCAP